MLHLDLHLAIIGLENQFVVFLRATVLHRFYCKMKQSSIDDYIYPVSVGFIRVPTSSGNYGKPGKSLKKFHA